jgi:hypothetical protein
VRLTLRMLSALPITVPLRLPVAAVEVAAVLRWEEAIWGAVDPVAVLRWEEAICAVVDWAVSMAATSSSAAVLVLDLPRVNSTMVSTTTFHHFHNRRFFVSNVFFFGGYPYYGYGDCYWLKRKAIITGSPYWWARYENCVGYY